MPEHTISENLTRLVNATEAIGSAITAKGGTVNSGDGLEEFVTDIGTIPAGGGGSVSHNDVNFYDYDGTIVKSYSASEFANLTALPSNPTHEGLTAQGWNWTLSDAKTYVADYGKLNIGQMYITDDGKTRVYISLHEGRLSPVLGLGVNGSVDIDWGDDTEHTTLTGSSVSTEVFTQPHDYAAKGDYVIVITPSSGSTFGFVGNSTTYSRVLIKSSTVTGNDNRVYQGAVTAIEIGDSVTSIGGYAFYNCSSLASINIPDSITSIDRSAFHYCSSLASITIPDSVASIGNNAFSNCYSLTSINIPDSVASIGNDAFYSCYLLTSITIPDSVASTIQYCSYCSSLASINIPDSITSIYRSAFFGCSSLASITIPDSVASIGNNAFSGCYGLGTIKFMSTTPATVSDSKAWTRIPTDCIIYIPLDTYTTYTNATNYPNSASYNYVEYATYASGVTLPSTNTGGTRTYTWYATIEDWLAQANPITVGNGKEIYCRSAAV